MTTTTMHLRSPGELITAIPYILGFEPADSLVAIALKDGRVGLTSRIDLPDPDEPDTAVGALMPALRREAPDQVILIGYEATPGSAAAVLDAFAVAAALKPEDIDLDGLTIHVRRQVQRSQGSAVEIKPPKAGSGRVAFVPHRLIEMLTQHLEATGRREWLFADDGQPPPHQNTVGHWWRTACKKAGVSYRLHDLRHFYASGLIAAGCDVVTVQRALGHSKATTTLDTYSHLWPTAEDRTRKAAAHMLADSLRTARGIHAV